jgi:hypothetical protein
MRTCCWQPRFAAELKRIEPDARYADEIIEGVDWILARNPTWGTNIPNTQIWHIVSRDIPKKRNLLIYYTFTDDTVYLLSVLETDIHLM